MLFEQLSLPDVGAVARRTMIGAIGAGVVGLLVALLLSQPWVALGLCIGLAMGMLNYRMILRSIVKVGQRMNGSARRPLAMNTVSRLMLMTVVALVLLWVVTSLGFGVIGGLALFQVILLANVTRSMLKAAGSATATLGGVGGLLGGLAPDAFADEPGAPQLPGAVDRHDDGRGAA